jgi:hypothetical protein
MATEQFDPVAAGQAEAKKKLKRRFALKLSVTKQSSKITSLMHKSLRRKKR